ncbi:LLM class F420-dependent oxidoreductase [Nocardioides zeae]|uniref:LLM class F420-dependent oxidoreductase n=1 Tax=Nocardioides zeae TaxID=1457234 RepID=UPI0030844AE1
MRIRVGAVLPQRELGTDPATVRRYLTTIEDLGFSHVLTYEHVLGEERAPDAEPGPYDAGNDYHEPLVLLGFAAAACRLELVTGVLVLPQRQAPLVAKQAAEVALLSGGRLRLGVGVGWNRAEYDALGARFGDRGRRLDEQVRLLRAMWSEPVVELGGRRVGLSPRPAAPVPIWFGGSSPAAYQRIGRLGDGWLPQVQPGPDLDAARALVERAAEAAGRDPAALGMEGRLVLDDDVHRTADAVGAWAAAGATHVSVDSMSRGLRSVDDHLAALADLAGALGLRDGSPREAAPTTARAS